MGGFGTRAKARARAHKVRVVFLLCTTRPPATLCCFNSRTRPLVSHSLPAPYRGSGTAPVATQHPRNVALINGNGEESHYHHHYYHQRTFQSFSSTAPPKKGFGKTGPNCIGVGGVDSIFQVIESKLTWGESERSRAMAPSSTWAGERVCSVFIFHGV